MFQFLLTLFLSGCPECCHSRPRRWCVQAPSDRRASVSGLTGGLVVWRSLPLGCWAFSLHCREGLPLRAQLCLLPALPRGHPGAGGDFAVAPEQLAECAGSAAAGCCSGKHGSVLTQRAIPACPQQTRPAGPAPCPALQLAVLRHSCQCFHDGRLLRKPVCCSDIWRSVPVGERVHVQSLPCPQHCYSSSV